MADSNTLYMTLELQDNLKKKIQEDTKDTEKLSAAIKALNVDLEKLSADKIQKNVTKNIEDATKAMFKLLDTKEKIDSALSRNMSMRSNGFIGMEESQILKASGMIDEIIAKIMNIGVEANFSRSAVKDMLASMNADLVMKDANSAASSMSKGLDKQIRDRAKAEKEAAKDISDAFKDADKAAKNNAKNQELIKDALARIATARANLSAASANATMQDQAHAKLLMSLLDQLSQKLSGLKGEFLGEQGFLDGILGSGYKGLMRNVDTSIKDIMRNAMNRGGMGDAEWESLKASTQAAEEHKKKLQELTVAFDRLSKAEERERQQQAQATAARDRATQKAHQRAQASAEAIRNFNKEAESVAKLRLEMLKAQAVQLQGIIKSGKGVFDAAQMEEYRNALRNVIKDITTLKGVMANLDSFTGRNGSGLMAFASGTNYSPLIAHGQQAIEASKAVATLTESERRFVESLSSTSTALRNQGVLLNDLRSMAYQYLSLWGAKSFLSNIIETGGLLEQQRLSIGAILGSMDKANDVFGQIKNLALKSPFGVVELDKMSKQLTAYGFQYEELFDWTKRLADISAATGTEVSRLALALGHVRAEGALSGYTLRQFAMGNIPLLQKLSENLGITAKEVREKTKKKEIGYEDVKKVLEDLTNQGGMFYNAQEVMSQALNAKLKNLRDAFDIMYGEIAESGVGEVLKGILEALMAGAKEWKRYGTDILWVAAAFGVAKTASAAYTAGMTVLSKQMGLLAYNTKAYTASQVQQLASEGAITREQLLRAVASGRLSVEQAKLAGATLGVSEANLQQAATTGKVTQAMLGNAMATSRFSVAQLRLMATLKAQGAMFPVLRVSLMGVAAGFRAVGAAMKSFLPFLAIGAVVDFFSRYSQQMSTAKETAEEAASTMMVGLGNIKSMYDSMSKKPPQGTEEMATAVSNMTEALKENGAYSPIKEQVEGAETLTEKYNILHDQLEKISDAYVRMKYVVEAYMESANKVGGGWFSDTMEKDIKQYSEATIQKQVAKSMADKFADVYKQELEARMKKSGEWVEETMRDMDWTELMEKTKDIGWNLKYVAPADDTEKKYYEDATKALEAYTIALDAMQKKQKEVDEHMPVYAEYVKLSANEIAAGKGLDLTDMLGWDDDDYRSFVESIDEALGSLKIDEESKQHIREEIIKTFPEEIQVKINAIPPKEPEKLAQWQEDLQQYFDENKIIMTLSADETIQSVEKKLQESRKKAQEKMDSAGAILTYWKIQPDMSAVEEFAKQHPILGEIIKQIFGDYVKSKEEIEKIDKVHADTGLSVIDDKKKKGGSGSKTDKQLKQWKEEWSELKAFYSEYRKWAKEVGEDAALKKLRETGLWGQFFNGDGTTKYAMDNWEKAIEQFEKQLKGGTAERDKLIFEVGKEKLTPQYDEAKKIAEAMLKQLDEELKKQGKEWDLYKKILEATGDKGQAANIAFGGMVRFDNFAEQLRDGIEEELKSLPKAQGVSIDELLGMDQEALDRIGIFEKSKIVPMLKQLKDVEQQIKAEEVEKMLEAMKEMAGVEDQIAVAENKLAEARRKYGENSVQALAAEKKLTELRAKQLEDSVSYLRFYSAIMSMTVQEAEVAGAAIKENLVKQLAEGGINADKYLKSIKNVDAQLEKIRSKKGLLGAFASGGVKGVLSAKGEVADAKAADAAIKVQKAEKDLRAAREALGKITDSSTFEERAAAQTRYNIAKIALDEAVAEQQRAEKMQKLLGLDKAEVDSINEVISTIEMFVGALDGIADAMQKISDMFDALGQDERAAGWSDAADTVSAITSPIKEATNALKSAMNGDVGGAISGAVGIFTSPITAFAKLHDKKREREIVKSQQRVKELTTAYENLQKAMENALGGVYTTGGYDEMLDNLMKQREELQSQLENEEDKKDSDSGRIADYKQEIAEMDEQIQDFAKDFAKSIYDIDIKSWAKQLTDAVVGAWVKGEDAAEAFHDKVRDIVTDLTTNILTQKIMEAALAPVLEEIEQEIISKKGKLDEGSIERFARRLDEEGGAAVESIVMMLEKLKGNGLDLSEQADKASSSSSSTISKSITEESSNLLIALVNTIRADVSVNRMTLQQILVSLQMQAAMPEIARAQLTQLEQIAGNTRSNAESAALIYALLNENVNGGRKFRVN